MNQTLKREQLNTLKREQLIYIIKCIQEFLWVEGDPSIRDRINPDKPWNSTTLEAIAQVLEDFDLRPDERAPYVEINEAQPDRCPHGMFYTGAGACPCCGR
jgi:DMSO/TMAO reductase YedYZ molybdopterin-dependent catalytic subunit